MDYKLAITLLKAIDQLEGLEDLLQEHNDSYILELRKLADVDESLAEQVETLGPILLVDFSPFNHIAQEPAPCIENPFFIF